MNVCWLGPRAVPAPLQAAGQAVWRAEVTGVHFPPAPDYSGALAAEVALLRAELAEASGQPSPRHPTSTCTCTG